MTPPPATTAAGRTATTAAGREAAKPKSAAAQHRQGANAPVRPSTSRLGTSRTRTPERTTHRAVSQPGATPRSPRRVSGPARPAPTPRTAAATIAAPSPSRAAPSRAAPARTAPVRAAPSRTAPARRPPATPGGPTRQTRIVARPGAPKPAGWIHAPRLPKLTIAPVRPRERAEALLDTIVRGRAWIPVLAVLLVGIVAMQVEVLKLGASVGRSMNVATELSGENQILRASDSQLGSPSRIEALAARWGMAAPGPDEFHFVAAGTSVAKAITGIHAPDASSFTAALAQAQSKENGTTDPMSTTSSTTPDGATDSDLAASDSPNAAGTVAADASVSNAATAATAASAATAATTPAD